MFLLITGGHIGAPKLSTNPGGWGGVLLDGDVPLGPWNP